MTSLVGCHARALWPWNYGTLIGNPTPGIQWYKFRPPGVTPNRGMPPVRRFLSNYFDLLFSYRTLCQYAEGNPLMGASNAVKNYDFRPNGRIGTYRSLEWCHFRWHWMTPTQIVSSTRHYSTLNISERLQDGNIVIILIGTYTRPT